MPGVASIEMMTATVEPTHQMRSRPGTVYLVGAGPGDPDLITVKGLNILRRADVVLYDALLNEQLLFEAPPTARLIFVGKRAGCHAKTQEEINRMLCEMAYTYETVVRLKGGDPFVFGRGGEEMIVLRAAGIPVEIVPGVTSAIAAPAYAGVPVTHRNVAGNFAVVTGHSAGNHTQEQPWAALAQIDTLVILMGHTNLPHIVAQLLAAGRNPDTPALAVQSGTLIDQRVVIGTLATLADRVAQADLGTPATIVIGDVAAFAEELAWFPQTEGVSAMPTGEIWHNDQKWRRD